MRMHSCCLSVRSSLRSAFMAIPLSHNSYCPNRRNYKGLSASSARHRPCRPSRQCRIRISRVRFPASSTPIRGLEGRGRGDWIATCRTQIPVRFSPSLLNHIRVRLGLMGRVISFENHALANLRARVAAAEEANQDLIAFARGHSGAVASIHAAVLAAIEAEGLDHLLHVVTQEWPQILGLDAVAVALFAGEMGVRADASGLQFVDPRLIEKSVREFDGVLLRGVGRGHPLFGPACEL